MNNKTGIRIVKFFVISLALFLGKNALAQGETMELISPAFQNNSTIPTVYSCKGDDISPPLQWKNIPDKTHSFVLIMDDPDAPAGIWDHWILFNIPKTTTELSENLSALPDGAEYGKNSWGNRAYGGPCPPSGEHRYIFKLYALDTLLNLSAGVDKSTLETAMKGHILATATLTGRYKK